MKMLALSIFFTCLYGNLFSQAHPSAGQLSGTLVDGEGISLPHAFLFLKGYPEFNWASNSSGVFELRYPEVLKNDTLVVSLLGYHRVQVPLSGLNPTGNLIKLEEAVIGLNEVIVRPEDTSVEEMISQAIDKIPQNYPDQRHQLTGLYRKVSTNYEEFTHLVEAAVVVEDLGYGKDIRRAKIKMEALRQSDDHAETDPYVTAMKSKIRNHIKSLGEPLGPLNPIFETYPSNYLRTAYDPKSIFGKDGYRFMGIPELPSYHRFVGTELADGDTIYHIAISGSDPPDGSSYLKINGRNHAIVEYQLGYRSGEHQVYVKFKEVEGQYYPEIIRLKALRLINRDVGVHQMDIHTLWFDKVSTEEFKKIKSRDLLKKDQVLEPNTYSFDRAFWENNISIKNHPLDTAVIESLEINHKLNEQFKRNAKD